MGHPAIRCRGLSKVYRLGLRARRVAALEGLDLDVEPGTIYGFVGPNGAGKSTTIKILVGLVAPSAGAAELFGQPVADPRARLAIGYLPENPSFHDFMRPLEVLRYLGALSGMGGADLERRAGALLTQVGLGHALDLTVRKFSKGMVQRLGLAQALLHDPPLLILDEPMSGLDPIGRKEVRDIVLDLARRGKTVFFSTHILPDVESICDRVGVILGGRLRDVGRITDLLSPRVRSVEVVLDVPEAARAGISGGALVSRDGDRFALSFPDLAAANAAVVSVVGSGGAVLSLVPHRETLEDFFVRRLEEGKAKGESGRAREVG